MGGVEADKCVQDPQEFSDSCRHCAHDLPWRLKNSTGAGCWRAGVPAEGHVAYEAARGYSQCARGTPIFANAGAGQSGNAAGRLGAESARDRDHAADCHDNNSQIASALYTRQAPRHVNMRFYGGWTFAIGHRRPVALNRDLLNPGGNHRAVGLADLADARGSCSHAIAVLPSYRWRLPDCVNVQVCLPAIRRLLLPITKTGMLGVPSPVRCAEQSSKISSSAGFPPRAIRYLFFDDPAGRRLLPAALANRVRSARDECGGAAIDYILGSGNHTALTCITERRAER